MFPFPAWSVGLMDVLVEQWVVAADIPGDDLPRFAAQVISGGGRGMVRKSSPVGGQDDCARPGDRRCLIRQLNHRRVAGILPTWKAAWPFWSRSLGPLSPASNGSSGGSMPLIGGSMRSIGDLTRSMGAISAALTRSIGGSTALLRSIAATSAG